MKCLKKLVAVAAVLLAGCVAAFAGSSDYEDVSVECIGNMTRKEFSKEIDGLGDAGIKEMVMEYFEDDEASITLKKFKLLTPKDVTDEIEEMHMAIEDEIPSSVKKNDVFASAVIRDIDLDNATMDGWFVFSHYLKEDDIYSYIYYFKISVDF